MHKRMTDLNLFDNAHPLELLRKKPTLVSTMNVLDKRFPTIDKIVEEGSPGQ